MMWSLKKAGRSSGMTTPEGLSASPRAPAAHLGGETAMSAPGTAVLPIDGHTQRWSLKNREGLPKTVPVLLGGSGNYDLEQTLRLQKVPPARSLRLEFYEVASDRDDRKSEERADVAFLGPLPVDAPPQKTRPLRSSPPGQSLFS